MHHPLKKPLGEIVAQKLRDEIGAGKWTNYLPSEIQLSSDLEVSRKTLRVALSILTSEGYLSDPCRGKPREILSQSKGSNLAKPKSATLIVITASPRNDLKSSMQAYLRDLTQSLHKKSIEIEFISLAFEAASIRQDTLKRNIVMHQADSYLVIEGNNQILSYLIDLKKPVFAIGGNSSYHKHCYNISYEITSTFSHAFHLLKRRGHQSFNFLHKARQKDWEPMEAKIINRLESRGISSEDTVACLCFHEPDNEDLFRKLDALFRKPDRPTALLTTNENVVATITWLAAKGFSVPQEVSILNIGDDPILKDIYPKLDIYATPSKPLALETSKQIERVLNGTVSEPDWSILECEYKPGDSVRSINQ